MKGVGSPQSNTRQRVLIGLAVGIAVIAVVGIATYRLLVRESGPPPTVDLPIDEPIPEDGREPTTLLCFFVEPRSGTLKEEPRTLLLEQGILRQLEQVLNALLAGSSAGLVSPIPTGTELQHAFIDRRQVAYLDFSSILREQHPGGTTAEQLTVEAILRTVLRNFPERIRRVQILIDGTEVESLAGHVDLSRPLGLSAPISSS